MICRGCGNIWKSLREESQLQPYKGKYASALPSAGLLASVPPVFVPTESPCMISCGVNAGSAEQALPRWGLGCLRRWVCQDRSCPAFHVLALRLSTGDAVTDWEAAIHGVFLCNFLFRANLRNFVCYGALEMSEWINPPNMYWGSCIVLAPTSGLCSAFWVQREVTHGPWLQPASCRVEGETD